MLKEQREKPQKLFQPRILKSYSRMNIGQVSAFLERRKSEGRKSCKKNIRQTS